MKSLKNQRWCDLRGGDLVLGFDGDFFIVLKVDTMGRTFDVLRLRSCGASYETYMFFNDELKTHGWNEVVRE